MKVKQHIVYCGKELKINERSLSSKTTGFWIRFGEGERESTSAGLGCLVMVFERFSDRFLILNFGYSGANERDL